MKNWVDISQLTEYSINDRMEQDAANLFAYPPLTAAERYVVVNFTQDQVLQAMGLARAIREASQFAVDPHYTDVIGKPTAEIQAWFDQKLSRHNRSAGARALSRKYGKNSAERIIQQNTGRNVRLQS